MTAQLLPQPGGFEGLIPINDRIDTNRPSVPELPDVKQAHLAWHATFVSFAHPTDLNEDAVYRGGEVHGFELHPFKRLLELPEKRTNTLGSRICGSVRNLGGLLGNDPRIE